MVTSYQSVKLSILFIPRCRAVQKSETWGQADPCSPPGPASAGPLTGSYSSYTRHHLWDTKRQTKCFSINELHCLEVDTLAMKAIV